MYATHIERVIQKDNERYIRENRTVRGVDWKLEWRTLHNREQLITKRLSFIVSLLVLCCFPSSLYFYLFFLQHKSILNTALALTFWHQKKKGKFKWLSNTAKLRTWFLKTQCYYFSVFCFLYFLMFYKSFLVFCCCCFFIFIDDSLRRRLCRLHVGFACCFFIHNTSIYKRRKIESRAKEENVTMETTSHFFQIKYKLLKVDFGYYDYTMMEYEGAGMFSF